MNKEILHRGKKIFYRSKGSGRPVMLVHGFGEDGNIWNQQAEHLENKFHLLIPDLPGSGQSEMIDDMSMEGMAEILYAIIKTENHASLIMIGHSMGGYITLAFAEKYPEYLEAFGLFHSTAFADTEEKKLIRQKGIEFIKEHGAFEFLKTSTPNLFSPNSKLQIPNFIEPFIQSLESFSGDALVAYYHAMMQRPDRTALLKSAKIPILFVMGEYDNAVPLQDGLKQCHLPEKSYIHILKKSGHMGMMEEPDKVNRILEEFLLETRN